MPTDIFANVTVQEEPFRVSVDNVKVVVTSSDPVSKVVTVDDTYVAVFRYESTTPSTSSFGVTVPDSVFDISGSPIVSNGVIDITFKNVEKNTVLCGKSGASGQPSFRSLVSDDIPDLSGVYISTVVHDASLSGNGTEESPLQIQTGGIIGSVSSVAIDSTDLMVYDSPITDSGTITLAIANTGVTSGKYGSVSAIPVLTVSSKGQIIEATTVSIPNFAKDIFHPFLFGGM
jgi:hypothetical protein